MATPRPDAELRRLDALLAKGLPPLLLLTGDDDWFRGQAVERALAAVPERAELRIVDAAAERATDAGDGDADEGDAAPAAAEAPAAAAEELQELRGGGLFARIAFVVVRRGAAWWTNRVEAVAAAMPTFAPGCGLIVEAKKLDRRKKAAQALVKAAGAAGASFEFRSLYELPYDRSLPPERGELCEWVVAEARRLGLALQPEAAWLVVQCVGRAPGEIHAELRRLVAVLGDAAKRPLAAADLRGRLTIAFEATPFEFAEAVLGGERAAAFGRLRAIFDRGLRDKEGKPMDRGGLFPFVTSWLFGQLAKTYEGRQLLDDGAPLRDLAARAGVFQFQERFVDQVRRHDRPRLARGLLALHECQRQLRLGGEEPDVLLERFLRTWFDGAPVLAAGGRDA
jgi:DNA polymerase III delta subunit